MQENAGNVAMDVLAARLHRLNNGIKELQKLNIDTTLSSLPKYAVVGDQSAGKSSIVQALCGTSLPRSSGTTTRCPFLITTHKAPSAQDAWICEVSIKRQDYNNADQEESCDHNESHITQFALLTSENQLEDTLRRAQIAILNPQDDPRRYARIDLTEKWPTTALFSRNIICLDIQAPDLPELMFYDPPGCINVYDMPKTAGVDARQSQDQERQLIEMITSTVSSYIKDEQCLLLLACSADQDVELSLTMKHIRHHGAENRCIGVFTKADLVTSTRLQSVQDILSGRKYELGKGWFVTKQLSQQEIDAGVDYDTARERERDLFATSPWADSLSLRDRYGLPKLQDEIADSLANHIVYELPNLIQRLETRITTVRAELDQYPAPAKEPNFVVMKSIEQFVLCLASHINADSDDNPFRMQFDEHLSKFGKDLRASRLEINVEEAGEDLDDGDSTATSATQAKNTTPNAKRKKRSSEPASCKRVKSSPFKAPVERSTYRLSDLQIRYDRGATNSIPDTINDKVTEQLIRDSCAGWNKIVTDLLKNVGGLVRRMIKDSLEEALSELKHTKLYDAIQQATLDYFNKVITTEGEGINQQLARMHACPTTLNKTFEGYRRGHFQDILKLRYPDKWEDHNRTTSSMADLANVPLKDLRNEATLADKHWIEEMLADDKYAEMIKCVAKIHTVHEILSFSLTDIASMQLKFDVLVKLRNEAAEVLRAELKVLDRAHCTALLAEDPVREKRRKQLLAEKAKLEKALTVIENLEDTE